LRQNGTPRGADGFRVCAEREVQMAQNFIPANQLPTMPFFDPTGIRGEGHQSGLAPKKQIHRPGYRRHQEDLYKMSGRG
jgi:hypothetical protein